MGMHQEELRQEEKMSTTEIESLGTIPTTSSTSTMSTQPPTTTQAETTSHSGFIEWAPYRGKDRKNLQKKKRTKVGKFPNVRPVKGRWISRDKAEAKLLNVRPGFVLPEMEVGDYPIRETKLKGKSREKRHTGDHGADG